MTTDTLVVALSITMALLFIGGFIMPLMFHAGAIAEQEERSKRTKKELKDARD